MNHFVHVSVKKKYLKIQKGIPLEVGNQWFVDNTAAIRHKHVQAYCNMQLLFVCLFVCSSGMFSDGNFSYGIEPVGSGEVSQDFKHTHIKFLGIKRRQQQGCVKKFSQNWQQTFKICWNLYSESTVSLSLSVSISHNTFSPDGGTLSLSYCMKSIELIHNPPPLPHFSSLISKWDRREREEI